MKRIGILFVVACLFLHVAVAQQSDFSVKLQEKLKRYYERHVPVKIHLTFSQQRYVPGDTAFYRIHFFTSDNFLPVDGRHILTVVLLDNEGTMVHEAKILLTGGEANNHIPIPVDAAPGRYTVIAFNEVMKEYDPTLFFQS